ncbi:MAG: hypothetical protein QOD98_1849 [Nocardioidaceae bacterium]|nr:hypothetical protein [Nocardioidaceae bacterium]
MRSMDTRIAPRQRPRSGPGTASRYTRWWTTAALVAAAVWITVAILQSPLVPLLGMAAGLGAVGGVVCVRAPASSAKGRRQYAAGALGIAGLVLVTVGVGHHPAAGLTVVVLLACSSPPLIRWIARA